VQRTLSAAAAVDDPSAWLRSHPETARQLAVDDEPQPCAEKPKEAVVRQPSAWWLAPIALLIVLSYLLPYTVFRDVDAWYGSLLFWTVATAIVIAINAVVSSAWKD
jgi:hypothetical protein